MRLKIKISGLQKMYSVTHSAISIFFNLVILSFYNFSLNLWHLVAMIIFSILPDIDSPNSFAGKIFFFVSKRINVLYGHRGFFHSISLLLIIVALTIFVFFIFPKEVYIFVLILYLSYFSHLVSDCFNISGVRLFYPSSSVYIFPKNENFRFRSGNLKIEVPIIIIFLLFSTIFYLTVYKSDGFISYLRIKFAKPAMAEEQFTDYENSKYYADIKIYDKVLRNNLTFENVEVLFTDKDKIIFFKDSYIKYYSNSDNFKIDKVSLKKSLEQFQKDIFSGDIKDILNKDFRSITGKIYVKLDYKNDFVNPEGDTLKLFFASKDDVIKINNLINENNKKISSDIEEIKNNMSYLKIQKTKRNISTLTREKEILISGLQKAEDITTKIDLSDKLKKIDSKLDSLNLELTLFDSSDDEENINKIKEMETQIIKNVKCEVVLIK